MLSYTGEGRVTVRNSLERKILLVKKDAWGLWEGGETRTVPEFNTHCVRPRDTYRNVYMGSLWCFLAIALFEYIVINSKLPRIDQFRLSIKAFK